MKIYDHRGIRDLERTTSSCAFARREISSRPPLQKKYFEPKSIKIEYKKQLNKIIE